MKGIESTAVGNPGIPQCHTDGLFATDTLQKHCADRPWEWSVENAPLLWGIAYCRGKWDKMERKSMSMAGFHEHIVLSQQF